MKVAVIGGAGYVAGELLRLLLQHPGVTECVASSRSQAGKPIGEVHPALAPLTGARFSGATAKEAARSQDVVFLALEHGASSTVVGEIFDAGPALVIDLAADFRVQDLRLYERCLQARQSGGEGSDRLRVPPPLRLPLGGLPLGG